MNMGGYFSLFQYKVGSQKGKCSGLLQYANSMFVCVLNAFQSRLYLTDAVTGDRACVSSLNGTLYHWYTVPYHWYGWAWTNGNLRRPIKILSLPHT